MRKWISSAAVWFGALAWVASALAASPGAPPADMLTAVPEPSTVMMVGAGLAGIAFLGRRRGA